jgi:PPOX class probable F420-dependent enzyme
MLEQFEGQSYLSLKTYRKNGDELPTPVWFVQDGDKFYIRTLAGSGKVKRIYNTPKVQIMPCGQMGEFLGTWVPAQAHEVLEEAVVSKVNSLVSAKYGDMAKTFEAQARERGQKYTLILIEPVKS